MHWLQNAAGKTSLDELQLDIVGFLAILGEGSVLANAQVSTLSRWIFLPRLIPAPQAMMRPTRPNRLEPVNGRVTGVYSGNDRLTINHVGNVVCDASSLPEHSVRVVSIRRTSDSPLKSKALAPLTIVLFLGFFLSCILLGISIWQDDGMSIVAVVLLSLLTSLIGWGNKWTLELRKRKAKTGYVPKGDVVIHYPKGSFLIVRCEEGVARELYFATETIRYFLEHESAYRILTLVGTMMLMGGVICLANAQIIPQIAWAGSYMLLGSSYWIVAALPARLHWDHSCYEVVDECLSDSTMTKKGWPSENETFTWTLWKVIAVVKSTDWVLKSNACPDTEAWRDWLNAARVVAQSVKPPEEGEEVPKMWQVPDWDPQSHLATLLNEQAQKDERSMRGGIADV